MASCAVRSGGRAGRHMGRPETDQTRRPAMRLLGNGLYATNHHEEALSVQEAELSMERRRGASKEEILEVQNNLAGAYDVMGRRVEASNMLRDVYSGRLKLHGEENRDTIAAANNYATTLLALKRFEEAKSLLRKTMAVARRVVGDNHEVTLRMKWNYAAADATLYSGRHGTRTLGDLREAVTTLEETERTARRVLGGAHPMTKGIQLALRESRAALSARDDERRPRGAESNERDVVNRGKPPPFKNI